MGIGARTGRPWRAALLLAAGAVAGGGALAMAGVPDSNGVVHACVRQNPPGTPAGPFTGGPNVRIIDPSLNQSCNTDPASSTAEQPVSWNQTGVTGNAGPPGQNGLPGPAGPPGPTTTVVSGQKLTLAGGQVITVSPPVESPLRLVVPSGRGGRSLTLLLGNLTLELGSVGVVPAVQTVGAGARKVRFNEFTITRKLDKASPTLSKACASGKHFPQATIVARKAGKTYLEYTLTDVIISSYSLTGAGEKLPGESLTLDAGRVAISYGK